MNGPAEVNWQDVTDYKKGPIANTTLFSSAAQQDHENILAYPALSLPPSLSPCLSPSLPCPRPSSRICPAAEDVGPQPQTHPGPFSGPLTPSHSRSLSVTLAGQQTESPSRHTMSASITTPSQTKGSVTSRIVKSHNTSVSNEALCFPSRDISKWNLQSSRRATIPNAEA